jgi:serine/threonine protein phosphatase 1
VKSVCVIGDVHGCYRTLLALIEKLPMDAEIVFVGDLIDRGDSSREVVDLVKSMGWKCARGNHEQMMIDAKGGIYGNMPAYLDWMACGGVATLASYMDPFGKFMKPDYDAHIAWMEQLPLYLTFPDIKTDSGKSLLVTHSSASGVWHWDDARRKTMNVTFEKALMWSRPKQISDIDGIYNVFGHTPLAEARVSKIHANVDTGCVFKADSKTMKESELTALQFPEMILHKQANIDKKSFYY